VFTYSLKISGSHRKYEHTCNANLCATVTERGTQHGPDGKVCIDLLLQDKTANTAVFSVFLQCKNFTVFFLLKYFSLTKVKAKSYVQRNSVRDMSQIMQASQKAINECGYFSSQN